jgi:drug/metabolite transporter (DMT)-like permease
VLLAAINRARGQGLPMETRHIALYVIIALIGTLLPNSASYTAAIHLPSGILSIVLSLVPMLSFPIALAWAWTGSRPCGFLGLCLGLAAILLIALPETSLPDRHGLVAAARPGRAAFYAVEGNFVARFGTAGLDPVQVLLGASIMGSVMALAARADDGTVDLAAAALGRAGHGDRGLVRGPCAGLFWLCLDGGPGGRGLRGAGVLPGDRLRHLLGLADLLGETYSGWVWAAVALMFMGLFLVQPRPAARQTRRPEPRRGSGKKTSLAGGHPVGDDARRGRD